MHCVRSLPVHVRLFLFAFRCLCLLLVGLRHCVPIDFPLSLVVHPKVWKPETVLIEMDKAIDADDVYAHIEVSRDEVKVEEKIEAAMKEENVEMKYFWGSTSYYVVDLPFNLDSMPSNYEGFRD
ncbi:Rossmann-like alpha/beta/alpha sandwich fold [Sesbania bispinosa]|nr:Rossmann-like alpha/beta/alpha sandwich fold [Sesbania bispinosa]